MSESSSNGYTANSSTNLHTHQAVGLVDGSVRSSTQNFGVVLNDDERMQLDELVVCPQIMPDGTTLRHYGIVVEGTSFIEGADFTSDTHRISGPMPTGFGAVQRCAEIKILRTEPEIWVPPGPGTPVYRAKEDQRRYALFLDTMEKYIGMGLDQSDNPVYADFAFINGEKGGHLSISGVSGVATKTSYALFFLHQLFETQRGQRLLGEHLADTRALVFNVKGEDLLHIDQLSRHFDEEARQGYERLEVENPQPFTSVRFFAPVSRRSTEGSLIVDVKSRPQSDLTAFGFTPREFIAEGLLRYAMEDEGGRNQVEWVRDAVIPELMRHASPAADNENAVVISAQPLGSSAASDPETLAGEFRNRTPRRRGEGDYIRNFSDLVTHLAERLDPDQAGTRIPEWNAGSLTPQTRVAFVRRLYALRNRLGHLVSTQAQPIDLTRERVNVVDIHGLHADAQRFVVGVLLDREFTAKEGHGRNPLRFIVLDELNKYAPKQGGGPIKSLLKDIAERGRSLGVMLIGAQQSAKDVEEALVRNASLKIVGRLDASDVSEYRFLGAEMQDRASRIMPGTMIFSQPPVPAPIPVRFPMSPYSTNTTDVLESSEAGGATEETTGGGFLSDDV